MRLLPFVLVLTLAAAPLAHSATFCAADGSQLQAALSAAATNNEDDDVRITAGTKTFAVPVGFPYIWGYQIQSVAEEDNDLVVSGGWNANCTTMTPGAQHTVLDGQGQAADVLIVSRHSAYFVDPKARYTIRNLTVTGAGGGSDGIRALVSTTGNSAEVVLDRVQARGGTSTVYLYGGRIDVSHLLVTGVSGGNDVVELAPSRGGSRFVHSSVYDNVLAQFQTDYCAVRLTGVKTVANNLAFGNIKADGSDVTDAWLIAANFEPTPQNYHNHFRHAFTNFLYTVDAISNTNGVPAMESVLIDGYAVKQPRFGDAQDSGYALSPAPAYDVFGRPRIVHGVSDRGAVESTYCRAPTMPSIQDFQIDAYAPGGQWHPVGTPVGSVQTDTWLANGYAIHSGNTSSAVFAIGSDGVLRVANPSALGLQPQYLLGIEVTDACGTTSGSVRVNVTMDAVFDDGFE